MATKGGKRAGAGRKPGAVAKEGKALQRLPAPVTFKPKANAEPVRWSQAIADIICERLERGESLRTICNDEGMPDATAVLGWARNDKDGFAQQYARARETGYLLLADEIIAIADTAVIAQKTVSKATGLEITEGDAVDRSRLMVDTRKWMLSKMLPKIYGDKQQVELSGTVDIASTLMAARKRSGLS